jgi:hypothetical protein
MTRVDAKRSLAVGSYPGKNATLAVSKHVYVQHPPPRREAGQAAALGIGPSPAPWTRLAALCCMDPRHVSHFPRVLSTLDCQSQLDAHHAHTNPRLTRPLISHLHLPHVALHTPLQVSRNSHHITMC